MTSAAREARSGSGSYERSRPGRQRTALLVILSLVLGLVGATGVIPQEPAAAAVSVTQAGYWKFDETSGTAAADSVGGRTATLNSGASNTSGLRGASSLSVNGTTGAATTSGAVLNTSASFSVSAYVKLNTLTGYQTVVSQDGTNVSGFFLQLRGDTGRFAFSRESADAVDSLTTYAGASAAPVVGQWYHLTGVFNATARTLALYVNGRLQATTATTSSFGTSGSFAVGRARYAARSVDFLNGTIDEVRAFRGAVTADDVEQIADSAWYKLDEGSGTTAVDAGLTAINGTLVNGPSYTPGPLDSAVAFNGTDELLNANRATFDSSKSFSISAWARANQLSSSRVVASADGNNYSTFLLATTSTGRWAFSRASADVASPTPTTIASTATATAGTWYHLAGVYDSVARTLTFYVDGVKQGASVSYTTGWRANGNLIVGRGLVAGAPAAYFSGAIDEVHTYPFAIDDGMAAQLAEPTPPPTPATPTATSPTSTSVTVNWVAPNPISGSPTTGYVVTPYVNGVAQAPQTFNTTVTTRTFSGLTTGGSYRYTVAAINANGTSSPSAQSVAVVPAASVPGAPTAVSATAGSESATVRWTAPSSNGGSAITGYVVTPYIGTTAQTSQAFASTATTQRITGLTAGTAYTFRVAARNAAGTGTMSIASAAVTPNTLPTLTFADPPPGSVGLAYSTQLTATGGTSPFVWSVATGSLPAGLTLSSTGLLSGTPTATGSSTFTVRAVDASGESADREVTLVVTGPPATPARPTATAGLAEATVSWVSPAPNGATITSYLITPFLAGVAQTPVTVDAAATTRVLTGLTVGGSYTFTVAAVNARGTSSTSPASLAVVPYAALNAPAITAVRAGSSSAVLTWTAPSSDGGSTVTGYQVTPYIGSVAQTPQTFIGTATTRTVTGLTPGTAYTFRVAALNTSGTTSLFRVNAGGPLVATTDDGPSWSADNAATNPYHGTGSNTALVAPSATFDGTIPVGTPAALFDSERWDPGTKGDGGEMLWQFPVAAGAPLKVRVYFAERAFTAQGTRVFDVNIDGVRVLDDFDTVVGAGGSQRATLRQFRVTSDGVVDIGFGHEVENPEINAIEIIQTGLDMTGPASASSAAITPNASPTLSSATPPAGQVAVAYSHQIVVTGGTSPFAWSVSGGSLPAGLTLNPSTGLLSGTPTAAGTFNFTVQVTDASGESATKVATLVIAAALAVTFTPAAGEVSVAYNQQPTRTGGTAPYRWAITAGGLPTGLTVNADTGLISGTPTAAGTASFTLTVTDGLGATASRTTSIAIAALPTLNFTAPAAAQVAVAYSTTFTAAGGTAPLVWSVSAGSLPSGLALNSSTGVLSGTPTAAGSSTFTVLVTDSFGKTASRAVTLVVNPGPLLITKTADVSSVAAGGTVAYTIAITNTGSSAFTGVNLSDPLTDVLDDAVYSGGATASTGSVTYAASTLSWTGDVAAGATVTITYSVVVNNPDLGNKVLAGTVTSPTLGTSCPSGGGAPACTTTVTVSGLSIVHTAKNPTTTPGSTVSFSVVVTNTGRTPYTGATFTENLAGMLDDATYTGATTTSGSLSYASPTLTWTGNLAVGATATITYSLTVANPDNGNRSLTGTVTSPTSGSSCPGDNPATSCTATTTVLVPALSITNTAGVSTTTPGATVPYTITLANTGQTAYEGTSVSLALAGALDDATYNSNATTSAGTVVYDAGAQTLVWTGAIAVGGAVTITASVTVRDPDPGNKVLTTVASSSAPGSTCPVGSPNSACTSSVQVLVPALTITKSSSVTSTTPGSVVGYTILVTNTGQTAYTAATLSDNLTGVLDDAAYGGNAAATSGAVSYSSPNVVWTGNLAIGASATITYSVTVNLPDNGNRSLLGVVTSATQGANCQAGSGDARCTSTVPVLIPGLTITTTADATTTTPGSRVRYTTTVTNSGETTYTGAAVRLDFAGLVDDATTDGVAVVSTGSLAPAANNQAVWTLSLTPGQVATVSSSFTVRSPATGDKLMRASASSTVAGSTCPTGTTNTSCSASVTVLIPGLTITKTADRATVETAGTVAYTIVVANTGQTAYTGAGFTDSLAAVLDDAVYAGGALATSGTVSYTAPVLAWSGDLAVGASATITYAVAVRDPDPGDKRMANTVVSTTAGSNCASTSTDSRCTAVVDVLVPGLTIVKTADATSTVPGGPVDFTVKVTNSGTTLQSGATFADQLSGVLDDATYAGGATATAGTLGYASSVLTWTGDLAVGASATITYRTTVTMASDGDNRLTNKVVSTTRGSNCAAGTTDAHCQVSVPVARLLLVRTAPTSTTPGSVVEFPVAFTNTGQVPYVGISVTMPRKDSADDVYATNEIVPSSGTIVRTTEASVWTGDIPVGGVVTIPFSRTVYDPPTGDRRIKATLVSDAPGNNCPPVGGSDPRCSMDIRVLVPALSIAKTASTTSVAPGGTVGYTVTITNAGETPYSAASVTDSLVGVLDDAVYNADAVASAGTVSFAGSTVLWTGDLAVGATATITYSVTANDPGMGDKSMSSRVASGAVGSSCPPTGTSPSCTSEVQVLTPGLTITKSVSSATTTLGATVVYTVVVANIGQTSYPAAGFSDALAGVLDDASYLPGATTTATSGVVGYDAGVVSWSGALAPGASATVRYSVSVNNPASGDLRLTNQVTSTSAGSNCAVGSGDVRCATVVEVLNSVALSIVKTASVASTVPGAPVTFTLRLTNPTDTTIFGATVTDSLTDVLDDATYTGATANVGVVGFSSPDLTWTGNVAARRTVTVTYTVTVGTAGAGNELLRATTVSTSPATSNSCLPGSTDPACTVTVPVAQLDILQSADVTTTTPGGLITVTGTFTNTGQVAYTGILIKLDTSNDTDDAIPEGDTSSAGSFVRTANDLTWTGDIPVGATITTTRLLRVKNPDPGDKVITATHRTEAPGSNCAATSTDPRCTFSVTVLVPALTISTAADRTFVEPNGVVTYTITVDNTGQTPYTSATVTDALGGVLDDATYNSDAVTTRGTVVFSSPNLIWTGDLAVGQTATVTFTVTAQQPPLGDKGMSSRVSSTAPGSTCLPTSGSADCINTVDVRTPALTTVVTASRTSALPGDVVAYTVTATNTGQTDYATASFSAPLTGLLDDAAYDDNAQASAGSVVRTGDSLMWSGPLGQGAAATVTYSVTVRNPVPVSDAVGSHRLEQTITSTVPGTNCGVGTSDSRCATSVPIASLHIVNSVDVTSAKPTDKVGYTGTFTNTGQVPYVGITISDSFVGTLDNAAYNGDAAADSGSVSIVVGSGKVEWIGDVAVGQTVTIRGSVTVNNPRTGNGALETLITTTAPASNCPVGGTDPTCRTSVAALTPALTVSKTASTATTTPGGTVRYTITAANTGDTAYLAAQVSDDLAGVLTDATYSNDATADRGSVAVVGQRLTWTGDLGVGQAAVITYSVVVNTPDLGDKVLVNRVVSDELGSTCPTGGAGGACTSSVAVLVPALDIAIAASTSTTTPGASVGYTVTITNTGQTDYAGAQVNVSLVDVLDDASYAGGATATTGSTAYSESTLTWTGNLAVGATATITYGVTVGTPATGNLSMRTAVSSAQPGSTCSTGSPCSNTVTVLIPGLSVSTTADVPTATPGDRVTFTITLVNTGQTAYVGTTVSTPLGDVTDDATFDGTVVASSGVASYTAPDLSWTGSLPVGATATISYAVTVRSPDPGNKTMTTSVISSGAGSTCRTAGASPACTATVAVLVPALSITKTADAATTTPGALIRYTIVATNTGQTAYTGTTVSDSLAEVLAHAAYNGDAEATGGGALSYDGETLRWTGDLLIGSTATIAYSVTVDQEQSGDKLLTNRVVSTAPGSTCPVGSTSSACLVEIRVLIPALQMTKTADRSTVVAGSPVTYTVTVTNTGETAYDPATFIDPLDEVLDDATYAGGATATSGTVEYVNGSLAWTGALAQGASAVITYSVVADFPVRGDQSLENTVSSQSAGATCPDGSTTPECTSVVTVLEPALTITKTADVSRIVAGGTVRYTLQATNTGAAPYSAAVLSDDLSDVLQDAAYRDDAGATTGNLGYAAGILSWTGGLAVGQSVTITYSVLVDLDAVSDEPLVNQVSSTTVGSSCPGGPACTSTVLVDAQFVAISDLTPSFTLTGLPGSTVEQEAAVGMTVTTNSSGGYSVSVRGTTPALEGSSAGNPDSIPIEQLQVRDSQQGLLYQPLSSVNPFIVHTGTGPSGPGGDAVSNDYQVEIPFVASDTYQTTLEYIVTPQ